MVDPHCKNMKEYLRDKLTGALIGLARATDGNEHLISDAATTFLIKGLRATAEDADCAALEALLLQAEEEKRNMVPNCFQCASPCGKNADYDMARLWNAEDEDRRLRIQLLDGIRTMAIRIAPPRKETEHFFYKALVVIGLEGLDAAYLQPVLDEMETLSKDLTA